MFRPYLRSVTVCVDINASVSIRCLVVTIIILHRTRFSFLTRITTKSWRVLMLSFAIADYYWMCLDNFSHVRRACFLLEVSLMLLTYGIACNIIQVELVQYTYLSSMYRRLRKDSNMWRFIDVTVGMRNSSYPRMERRQGRNKTNFQISTLFYNRYASHSFGPNFVSFK